MQSELLDLSQLTRFDSHVLLQILLYRDLLPVNFEPVVLQNLVLHLLDFIDRNLRQVRQAGLFNRSIVYRFWLHLLLRLYGFPV